MSGFAGVATYREGEENSLRKLQNDKSTGREKVDHQQKMEEQCKERPGVGGGLKEEDANDHNKWRRLYTPGRHVREHGDRRSVTSDSLGLMIAMPK